MLKILVVDDEQIERDGIRRLIEKYEPELEVAEAENGEEALRYLEHESVDIILTDIKMPFVDGLELAEKAKLTDPDVEIIIYSAFGEFDYAKRALKTTVANYLLKPIVISEFKETIKFVKEKCRKKKEKQHLETIWQEGYRKVLAYEKQNLLLDLLSGRTVDAAFSQKLIEAGLDYRDCSLGLMIVDFINSFFDMHYQTFQELLSETLQAAHEFIHLNEHQGVVLLHSRPGGKPLAKVDLQQAAHALLKAIDSRYATRTTIVFGGTLQRLDQVHEEMGKLERCLDYRFFYDQSMVFDAEEDLSGHVPAVNRPDAVVEHIKRHVEHRDFRDVDKDVGLLFSQLGSQGHLSVIYVKYLCMDIVKHSFDHAPNSDFNRLQEALNRIFACFTMSQLKNEVLNILQEQIRESPQESIVKEPTHSVVRSVIRIIETEYMKPLSLDQLAERAYLAPSYLSYLFKKETGQSLVRYITHYRIEKAKEMLTNTNCKIVDISEKVGFSNPSYFGLTFRNFVGMSPVAYRELRTK